MALDPGARRVGVAVSDKLGILASPVDVVQRTSRAADLQKLRALMERFQPAEVVIGVPVLPSGEPGPGARQSDLLADIVRREFGLRVQLWNESYSTVEALRLREGSRRARKRSAPVDAEAAAVFLQDYLDARR